MLRVKPWYRETPLEKRPCWVRIRHSKGEASGAWGEGMGAGGGVGSTANSQMDEGSGLKLHVEACSGKKCPWRPASDKKMVKEFYGDVLRLKYLRNVFEVL